MLPRAAVAAVLSAALVASAPASAPAAERAPLRLVWSDPSDLAVGIESVVRQEAGTLLRRLGGEASWRRASPGELLDRDEVWVILIGQGPHSAAQPLVLGAARRRDDLASVVWVHVSNVRAVLSLGQARTALALSPGERRALAVALGRVVAHEVVHALVPSLEHGSGLMSGTLSRRQLTGGTIPIEAEVVLAVQAAFRGDRRPIEPPWKATVAAAVAPKDR